MSNGGAIDDFVFKDYSQTLGSEEKIVLLNPSNVKDGYFFNTGWATNSDAEVPNSNTVWKIKSGTKLTPKNPIGFLGVNFVPLLIFQTVFEFGTSASLFVAQPVLKKYPSLTFDGFNKTIFSSLPKVWL